MTSASGVGRGGPFRDDGLVMCALRDLPVDWAATQAVQEEAQAFAMGPAVARARATLAHQGQPDPEMFEADPRGVLRLKPRPKDFLVQQPSTALAAWGLAVRWRQALEAIIQGQVRGLYAAYLWQALMVPPTWVPMMSQCWHRDPYERGMDRILKVFWYLEDVDAGHGDDSPFNYLRGSQERHKPIGTLLDHRYVHPKMAPSLSAHPNRVVCYGPADTVIVADTSGFHRGGLCRIKPRLSATLVYAATW